ncbi:MAG: CPBP family intramembrane metalloprotease [archaeon]|nr:CPBP family intramembrane metalloprotease [archaeon]
MLETLLTNFLLDFGLLLLPLLFILIVEKKKPNLKDFGFKTKGAIEDMALSSKIFLALLIYSFLLSFLFFIIGLNDLQGVQDGINSIVGLSPLLLVYFFLVRVFLEEFFFRAFLVPRAGVVISSVLFGITHYGYGSIGEIVGAVFLGMVLAIAYKQHGRILPNYVGHLLYNLVAISFMV